MRVLATCMLALGLAALPVYAGTGKPGDETPSTAKASDKDAAKTTGAAPATATKSADANKSDSKTDTTTKSETSSLENELQQLRSLIEAQSKQLQAQSDALKAQQEKMQVLEEKLNSAETSAPASASSSSTIASPVSIPAGATTSATTVAISTPPASASASGAAQDKMDEPAAIHVKGITITPGGFMAAETVWRGKALGSDINTPFNSTPVPGSSQSDLSEFFGSGRQSRISALVEGKLSNVKIGGYYEMDFLSAGVTSNNNQSNSYTARQRQFWAQAAFDSGWKITGGQMWSLVAETKSGMDNRTEATPMTIDAAYNVGFSWARQYGFRVVKSFGNNFFLAASVENPQTTLTSHGNLANGLLGTTGTTGGVYDNQSNYSFNAAPDFVVKAVAQPSWGHFEVFGVASRFRDRIYPCGGLSSTQLCSVTGVDGASAAGATNDAAGGGGIGANGRVSVLEKHVDLGFHIFGGSGVGRYGAAGLPDATFRPDGTIALLKNYQALATIEFHYPKFDVYLDGGGEYASRAAYTFIPVGGTTATAVGYGSPLFNNSGCYTEAPPSNANGFGPGSVGGCTADTRAIFEGTAGFWYRFYKGPKGTVQWGGQFSYVVRNTWAGTAAANGVTAPSIDEPMVLTSFRYYLP
jgi:hypothetical protein